MTTETQYAPAHRWVDCRAACNVVETDTLVLSVDCVTQLALLHVQLDPHKIAFVYFRDLFFQSVRVVSPSAAFRFSTPA
eukprot:COSAG02_NODE_52411_length_308_cov_0.612440_1_plen_78_part_10